MRHWVAILSAASGAFPLPSPACALIDYSSWDDVTHTDLGIRSSLEFTPAFISKMRLSMPFEGVSVVLLVLATLFALIGHCNGDHKTLIACTLYTLGGFSLAVGLIIFASVLSDAFLENAQRKVTIPASFHSGSHGNSLQTTKNLYSNHGGGLDSNSHSQSQSTLLYDYKYGWSFYVATVSFIMSEITAIISMTVYLKRFSSVEDMVRIMVPGGDRKLRQYHQNCQKKTKETDIVDPSPLSGEPLKSPIHSSTPSPSIADCKPGMGGESKVPDICTNAVHPKINRNDNLMGITVPIVTNNKKKVCKCKPQNRYNTVGNAVPNRRFNTLQPGVEPFSGLPNDTKYNSLDRYISGANRYAQDQTSSESSTSSILITNYKNNSTAIKTFNTLPHKNRLNRLDSQRLCNTLTQGVKQPEANKFAKIQIIFLNQVPAD
ncbi:hypothetical protein M8J75_000126 [Diaphorina citri]|nr:hypothetical protein M8J75_000126 [Diaphorina citri]